MRAFRVTLSAILVLLPMVSGCDSGVSKEELGPAAFEVPEVPGAEEPYKLPKLGSPPPESDGPFGIP